jgi:putative tricarboxylic transport membrane protein
MDTLHNVLYGFQVVLQPVNLAYCFVGVLLGTLVGVLPGLGPASAAAMLLPATFKAPPVAGVIMLAGIYYGAMYGGSTTSILVNIPGEAASVVTCLDGHQMALKGRAGPALGIAAFGSFIAGTFAVVALTIVGPPLAGFALKFGPPEYFALMVVGILVLTYLTSGSMVKSLMTAILGIILSGVGMDRITGIYRFCYGRTLLDGVGVVPAAMGLFGIAEVLSNLETKIKREIVSTPLRKLFPTVKDWKDSIKPILRGTVLGFFLGILPGAGGVIASFASYAIEKKTSKHPEEFGRGAIQGVAGPEAANNAAAGGAFIPMLCLGIPANPVIAVLMGGLMIHGLMPGPLLMEKAPDVFWGTIVSMYVGNGMLLVLNLPLIGMWVQVLKVPYYLLYPLILLFCLIGSYSLDNNFGDVVLMLVFGVIGYLMRKFRYDAAPLLLALVLGGMLESNLRQSLILSRGDFSIFVSRPITLGFLIVAAILLFIPILTQRKKVSTLE